MLRFGRLGKLLIIKCLEGGSPVWTTFATVTLGLQPAKSHENRVQVRMAVLGAARSRLAMAQARPSNCVIWSVRD